MTEAKKMLELIESVDPDDTDALNEIDARVWCLVNDDWDYETHFKKPFSGGFTSKNGDGKYLKYIPEYTRSRDALKAIRPEGWQWVVEYIGGEYYCCLHDKYLDSVFSCDAPTEELAELHAIIQAIEWERNNND